MDVQVSARSELNKSIKLKSSIRRNQGHRPVGLTLTLTPIQKNQVSFFRLPIVGSAPAAAAGALLKHQQRHQRHADLLFLGKTPMTELWVGP